MDYPQYNPFDALTENISDFDWEDINNQTALLPDSTGHILFGSNTTDFFMGISSDFGLSTDQSFNLSKITGEILIGNLFIGDINSEIIQRLRLSPETAKQITTKILNELFAPAMEDIKKMQREKFADRLSGTAAKPSQPVPQPQPLNQKTNVSEHNVIDLRNKP